MKKLTWNSVLARLLGGFGQMPSIYKIAGAILSLAATCSNLGSGAYGFVYNMIPKPPCEAGNKHTATLSSVESVEVCLETHPKLVPYVLLYM